ncbi:MAG: T9SS type A sorting domain-containing protein [Bacteroidales bacterium]|nr:T9SS type A sorting domain-containing protein [Bacteroidales bacterium]
MIADRDYTTYTMNVIGDSLIRLSLFLSSSAPTGTRFSGLGALLCVEFSRNFNFSYEDTAVFKLPLITESYSGYFSDVYDLNENGNATYITEKEDLFEGTIHYWADNKPMAYVPGVNDTTLIFGNVNPTATVTPNANGAFSHSVSNGTSITMKRDVSNSFDIQQVINGYDAYYTAQVLVDKQTFIPNVYQLIAMDVNRDGRVTAGDISQIQQRTVSKIGEFSQFGNTALDWVFVASTDLYQNPSFRISENYPLPDGVGFCRTKVPVAGNVLALPVENLISCPIIQDENFKAILLGDVTGNYASVENTVFLKSGNQEAELIFEIENTDTGYVSINIVANSESVVNAYDFSFYFDTDKFEFIKALDKAGIGTMECAISKDEANLLKFTAFGDLKKGAILTLVFKAQGAMKESDIVAKTSLINDTPVQITIKEKVKNGTVETNDIQLENDNTIIYPNPAQDELYVITQLPRATISLVSALGIVIDQHQTKAAHFEVGNLSSGFYVVRVCNESESYDYSVIIE